jgi:hypothetical protein
LTRTLTWTRCGRRTSSAKGSCNTTTGSGSVTTSAPTRQVCSGIPNGGMPLGTAFLTQANSDCQWHTPAHGRDGRRGGHHTRPVSDSQGHNGCARIHRHPIHSYAGLVGSRRHAWGHPQVGRGRPAAKHVRKQTRTRTRTFMAEDTLSLVDVRGVAYNKTPKLESQQQAGSARGATGRGGHTREYDAHRACA